MNDPAGTIENALIAAGEIAPDLPGTRLARNAWGGLDAHDPDGYARIYADKDDAIMVLRYLRHPSNRGAGGYIRWASRFIGEPPAAAITAAWAEAAGPPKVPASPADELADLGNRILSGDAGYRPELEG